MSTLPFDDPPGALAPLAARAESHQLQCRDHRRQGLTQLVNDGGDEPIFRSVQILDCRQALVQAENFRTRPFDVRGSRRRGFLHGEAQICVCVSTRDDARW